MPFVIEAPNTSVAWGKAVEHLLACGGECFNLMVGITYPLQVDPSIDRMYTQLLADYGLLSVKQVSYLVFPRSLYLKVGKNAERLFETYNRTGGVFERLKHRYPSKAGWGTYFRRMTSYPQRDPHYSAPTTNQLKNIIDMLSSRTRNYRSAYTISIQVPGQDGRRTRGGPCLNYVALQLEDSRVLNMLAVYRNHDFVQRAYGNYLSLGYLMEFLCDQSGYTLGKLTCVSSHASVTNLAGANGWPTKGQLRSFIDSVKQPHGNV